MFRISEHLSCEYLKQFLQFRNQGQKIKTNIFNLVETRREYYNLNRIYKYLLFFICLGQEFNQNATPKIHEEFITNAK